VLGDRDRLLVGYEEIAAFLAHLGILVTPRSLESWRPALGAPIRPGTPGGHVPRQPPLTSEFALTAWLLTSPAARLVRGGVGSCTRSKYAKRGRGLVAARRARVVAESSGHGHTLAASPS
jgi:hypothetical protein